MIRHEKLSFGWGLKQITHLLLVTLITFTKCWRYLVYQKNPSSIEDVKIENPPSASKTTPIRKCLHLDKIIDRNIRSAECAAHCDRVLPNHPFLPFNNSMYFSSLSSPASGLFADTKLDACLARGKEFATKLAKKVAIELIVHRQICYSRRPLLTVYWIELTGPADWLQACPRTEIGSVSLTGYKVQIGS